MNRTLVLGVAIFCALVGIALMNADQSAFAGHGCHGCHGCHGGHYQCAPAPCGCCGEAVKEDGATQEQSSDVPEPPKAEQKSTSVNRAPMAFRTASFRR